MRDSDFSRRLWLGIGGAAAVSGGASGATVGRGSGVFNVRDHGAEGSGSALDTGAIQKTIDACVQSGGGCVYFPPGRYLSGGIVLKSHVTLVLENGATLLGSKELKDYPVRVAEMRSYTDNYVERCLIYAENAEDIGIEGRGVIDGQGKSFSGPYLVRPYMIRMVGCRGVSVSGVTMLDSPMWVQHYLACDEVDIRNIRVHSRSNHNNDGIDIDCCHRVQISDCEISSGDDAIVLKSTAARPCKDVVVTNCVLSSACNGFKLGTETNGGFENIAMSNCSIYDTRLSGVTLQIVDGGTMDNVTVSNVTMRNVRNPIFIRLGNRARPFEKNGAKPGIGRMRNVTVSNIEAVGASKTGCAISGLPGHAIENLTLANIRLSSAGGGTKADASVEVPEHPERYPEHSMFGVLPAYGLYCRHVRNLKIDNVQTSCVAPDARPAVAFDDVADLEIAGARLEGQAEGEPLIRLARTKGALIHGCRVPGPVPAFVEVADAGSENISIIANEASRARALVTGSGARGVFSASNRTA